MTASTSNQHQLHALLRVGSLVVAAWLSTPSLADATSMNRIGDRHAIGSPASQFSIVDPVDWAQERLGRGAAVRGPRGGVAAGRRGAVVRPGRRPGVVGPGRRPVVVAPGRRPVVVAPGWRRPASYYWRPGGAIAAGAAIGFVGAAAAAAYAGSPPAPGYCWYYTDPQRTQGFWDACPR